MFSTVDVNWTLSTDVVKTLMRTCSVHVGCSCGIFTAAHWWIEQESVWWHVWMAASYTDIHGTFHFLSTSSCLDFHILTWLWAWRLQLVKLSQTWFEHRNRSVIESQHWHEQLLARGARKTLLLQCTGPDHLGRIKSFLPRSVGVKPTGREEQQV